MTKRKIEYWVIPPAQDAEFVACMEEVLETYAEAYNPKHPVLCMDEQPIQLLKETRIPIAATKKHGKRVDYEYERNGTASIFMFAEPLFRGDGTGLEQHYLPKRGKAGTSVQSFFTQEQESRVLCYDNTNLTRNDQAGETMRFVEFWREITDADPEWLYFDSKATTYTELSKLNQRGIWFITIRKRGAAILRRLQTLPINQWERAVIDTAHRRHQHIRYVDERVKLPDYDGQIRQVAVTGLGRQQPTLFLSNNEEETARSLIIRYAGRNRVEDALGISVNFFHLDCLASEVRLNVDLDARLTVLANGCYRWLAKQLRGFLKPPRRNNFSANLWRQAAQSRWSKIGSSCALTNAVTTRSCEKHFSTSRIKRFLGCKISPWSSSSHEGHGGKMLIDFRPWKLAFKRRCGTRTGE